MVDQGLETDDLLQQAILWPASDAVADNTGVDRVDKPRNISCRWSIEIGGTTDPNSDAHQVTGRVYVDREIPLNSILRRGTIEEPGPKQLYEVVGYCEKFDVMAEEARRYVEVSRWNGQLPLGA